MMKMIPRALLCGLGLLALSPAMAAGTAADWQALPGQEPVYGSRGEAPTCCYSENRIWRNTNSESGWSTRGRHFSPYGFANRENYRPQRPTPLPRGVESSNPWSGGDYVQRVGQRGAATGRGNAEFFRPAYYNYPPPVGPVPGLGGDPLDPLLMLPTPAPGLQADPYLGGLYLPGLAGPWGAGPWGAPGMTPGFWPGLW